MVGIKYVPHKPLDIVPTVFNWSSDQVHTISLVNNNRLGF